VPLREGQADPHTELNIVYDDLARMRDRIVRLTGAFAHAQDPPSRTVRSIAGFRFEAAGADEVIVRSTFILLEVRSGRQQRTAAAIRTVCAARPSSCGSCRRRSSW